MTAKYRKSEPRADEAADFLRRLSMADAKVLLERTRKEKENKTKEMQKMISVKYRDLIESADKIVSMHSSALRLEISLKEMPEMWMQMEMALSTALAAKNQITDTNALTADVSVEGKNLISETTGADIVASLIKVPEKMWQLLDEGKSLQALELYQQANKIHDERVSKDIEQLYPFLQTQWTCVQSFKPRMVACATKFLTCRGKESRFYAENLCTLAVLSEPPMEAEKLFVVFLDSRSKWLTPIDKRYDEHSELMPTKRERVLMIILKTLTMTITQTEEIFGHRSKLGILSTIRQLPPGFREGLEKYLSSGKLLKLLSQCFQQKTIQVMEKVSSIIMSIDSISRLSQTQSNLVSANLCNSDHENSEILYGLLDDAQFQSCEKPLVDPATFVFSVLYAEAFRKRTRDLVQNSFVEALEAIKCQIRLNIEDTLERYSRSDYRLKNVNFYDYFEIIQKNTAEVDVSDLQSVLTEEFLRAVFKLVVFFEQEYPPNYGRTKEGDQLPIVFLSIANMFAVIVAGFPCQLNKLFPGERSTVLIPEGDPALKEIGSTFNKYANNGFVEKEQLEFVLEKNIQDGNIVQACFIDEEMKQVGRFGLHSLYLMSETKQKASYSQIFVNVVHGLFRKYCEAWAAALQEQKIKPLRELIQNEQYDLTNEEWIATHDGWIEQVIPGEDLGKDTDVSSSESEMALVDEKVWLPWCETPMVSSFLFSCCYSLDDAYRLIQGSVGATSEHIELMQRTVREVLVEQVTIASVTVYDAAVSLLIEATQKGFVLNFGECCVQQFLFDMYFVRATLGFSDFVRFGWGDEHNPEECSPGLLKLKDLLERMREFIDPVDWEIYGPQLIENVVIQFRRSRLLFSSLSESNDINKINGKEIVIGAQDNKPLARIVEPVSRFSLLPTAFNRRKFQRTMSRSSEGDAIESQSRANSSSLFNERCVGGADVSASQSSAMKLQNILSSSTTSNILSTATSGSNLISSAAKGIGLLSSATTNRYF